MELKMIVADVVCLVVSIVTALVGAGISLACLTQLKRVKAQVDAGRKLKEDELDAVGLNGPTKLIATILLVAVAAGVNKMPIVNTVILVAILAVGIAVIRGDIVNNEVYLAAEVFRALGIPFGANLVGYVLKSVVTGWDWRKLLWLFPVVLFLIALTIAERVNEAEETEDNSFSTVKTIIIGLVAVLAIGGLLTWAAYGFSKKHQAAEAALAVEQEAQEAQESEQEPEPEIVEAVMTDTNPAEIINLAFAKHGLSEEDKALEADMVLPQLDPADTESKLSDYALGPISEEMLSPMREWLGWEVDWSSYPVNPVTEEMMTTARTHSAKELGYVDYTMSYATAPGFPKDWKTYAKARGLDENCTEDDAVIRWVGDLTGNYPAFIGMVELFGEAKTLGVKNRDIDGNEFFNEILDLAKKAEEENKGITKFLDSEATPAYSKYTFDWQTYRAKFMYWLMLSDFQGRKDWWTSEKSYLGPADNTVSEGMIHKFDYTNVTYIRPNFTTAKDRQTNLPSYPFCFKDKNGYRVSDFFGINCTNADAELYAEQPAAKKAQLKATAVKLTQQPAGVAKVTASTTGTIKKEEGKKVTPPTPRDKEIKKVKNSAVNNPRNSIDGKNPVGQGTDAFQAVGTTPTNWGTTVPAAQYQAQATDGTSGTSNPTLTAPAGTTVIQNPDGGTTETKRETKTDPNTGVETSNETTTTTSPTGETETSFTEGAEATTPEIPVKVDNDNDGNSSENTGMPVGGF